MRFLKLWSIVALMFLAGVVLAACDSTTVDPDPDHPIDEIQAGISAATALELKVGDHLDPLQGVTAVNLNGEDVLSLVTVSHNIPVDENGNVTQSGSYKIKYTAEIDGETYLIYRDVKVIYVAPVTSDLVINGDLSSGALDPFTKSEFDNGAATLSVVDKELKVQIDAVSWQAASPRVETNVFKLEAGTYYEVSFKARALEARPVQVQVGQLLPDAPWFRELILKVFDLTTEMTEYKVQFLADASIADLDQIQLLFGFGTMNGSAVVTDVYLDDIKVEKAKVESLLNLDSYMAGAEGDAKANPDTAVVWAVADAGWGLGPALNVAAVLVNGQLGITVESLADSVWFGVQVFAYSKPMEQDGTYKLSFKITSSVAGDVTVCGQVFSLKAGENDIAVTQDVLKDGQFGLSFQAGVDGKGPMTNGKVILAISDVLLVRTGDIAAPVDYADPANLFGVPAGIDWEGEGVARANPNKFYVWNVKDASWNCGPVANVTYQYEEGHVKLLTNLTEENWWFAVQLFYATKPIKEAGDHVLSFKLISDTAGKLTICGTVFDIVVGENQIKVPFHNGAGEQFLFSVQYGWLEDPDISHQFLGKATTAFTDFAIDGVPAIDPEFDGNYLPLKELVAGDENGAKADPGNGYYWSVGDPGWNCGPVSHLSVYRVSDDSIRLESDQTADHTWFNSQFFLYGKALSAAKKLKLSFVIQARANGHITVNGQVIALEAGVPYQYEEVLDLAAGAQPRLSIQLAAESIGVDLIAPAIAFTGIKCVEATETSTPDPDPQGDPTPTTNVIEFYTEGTGDKRNHVSGAGVWIWIKTASIGMTGENFGSYTITASLSNNESNLNIVDKLLSDLDVTLGIVRLYVVLDMGAETAKFKVEVGLSDGTNTYSGAIEFVNGELKSEGQGGGAGEDPQPAGALALYHDGVDFYSNRIEGAGAWMWFTMASCEMVDATWAKYSVKATVSSSPEGIGFAGVTMSDPNFTEGFFRVYVTLTAVPTDETITTINVELTDGTKTWTKAVVFSGTALKLNPDGTQQ